jgi:hypothetical protein
MRFARPFAEAPAPEGGAARAAVAAAARACAAAPLVLALAALVAAVAAQARFGAIADVSWMITISEKWLDGAIPYVDFIETNPPAAILLYLPPAALARALGAHAEFLVAAWGFAACGASAAAAAAILSRAGLLDELGPASLGAAVFALTLLPGRAFDERDFFVALLALPALAVVAARAAGAAPGPRSVVASGLCMAAVVAIKPPYALLFVGPAGYLAARQGVGLALRAAEYWLAVVAALAYAGAVAWFFPAYVADVLPAVVAAYLPVRESAHELIVNAAVVVWAAFAAALALVAGPRLRAPLIATPALAAVGALATFFIQGKGWLYQAYPALALIALALGAAVDRRGATPGRIAVLAAAAVAAALAGRLASLPPFAAAVAVVLVGGGALVAVGGRRMVAAEREMRLAELAVAAIAGAVWLFFTAPPTAPDRDFIRAVAALGPHPRLAAVAEGLGIGFPLVRQVDGVWIQRTQGMLLTSGARRLIDENPGDAALAARLAPIVAHERDMVAEDIRTGRPDAILVNTVNPRFHRWAMTDPTLAAAFADYTLATSSRAVDWPIDLYVRKDEIGLRRSLPDPAERSAP